MTQAEPLIEYVLSCHGNQNQYILEKYNKFRKYVEGQIRNGYTITKDAGILVYRMQTIRGAGLSRLLGLVNADNQCLLLILTSFSYVLLVSVVIAAPRQIRMWVRKPAGRRL